MTAQQAAQFLGWPSFPDGWEFIEITRAGQLSGFVMVQGCEIHAYRLPEFAGRWFFKADLNRVRDALIKTHGHASTKVRIENATGHRFVKRIGFKETHTDETVVHYRLERLNHAKHD